MRPIRTQTLPALLLFVSCLTTALQPAAASPVAVLFVGNSFTFGRVDPAMSYNAAAVHDLTAPFNALSAVGTRPWEPHPWGGIAGIFKQMTVEAGLDYDVSISARNGVSLRTHYLNAVGPAWDLRGNLAAQCWDVLVLQEQSETALPLGRGKYANPAQFRAYANAIEAFIHTGAARSDAESALYGSLSACQAAGQTLAKCETLYQIAANPHANPQARVYLTQTWARPDMVYPHRLTVADQHSGDGRPLVDTSTAGGAATLYYPDLAGMTRDLHAAMCDAAAANPRLHGVVWIGDAFQRAVDEGAVKSAGFYDVAGRYAASQPGEPMNLWWDDYLHASKYGSYLDALMQFGTITGRDPLTLGAGETAASELGISPVQAQSLQRIASVELAASAGKACK